VDVFFAISGYLIGALVYREVQDGTFRIAGFYKHRAKRILPALFGVLAFSCVVAIALLSPEEMKAFAEGAAAVVR